MPYEVYSRLYDSTVWPIISYGAAIWGTKSFSCINAVESRAMRFFLGTGRYTPNNALYGEFAWHPPQVKQWRSVAYQWHRISRMSPNRVNCKIFDYCNTKTSSSCKNWQYDF